MSDYKVSIKIAGQLEKSFNSALQGAQKGLEGLGSLGVKSVQLAAKSLTAAGAAISAVGVASVNVGREFEAQMSSTAATAGATEEEYKKLEAAAMEMGRSTSKTATESAAALEYMALAGWSVDESIKGLPSVLRLSEATGLDLARTSDLVTDSMSACGVTVDQLSGYLDICAAANNKSNQSAEELMEAYLGVGGTMANLNVPITESATALGVLANRGRKGSEAGNALNAIMANLTTGTGQAGKMMESLGISAFDSEGNFIGLTETLRTLDTALAGYTEEERNAALAAIGGKEHRKDLEALLSGLNTTLKDGSTEWENLQKQLESCDGALEAMAERKLDNLNGDIAKFQSALQDTGIKIYKNLQGPLRDVVQFGTKEIYKLSDALAEGGFQGMVEELGNVLADCVTEVANYAPQLVQMASSLMSSLMQGLVSNAPALTSAAATLATSIITAILNYISEFYVTGATLLAQFLQGMVGKMPEIIQAGIQATEKLGEGLAANAESIGSAAGSIIGQLVAGVGEALPILITAGADMLAGLAEGLSENAPEIITAAEKAVENTTEALIAAAPKLIEAGGKLIAAVGKGMAQGVKDVFEDLGNGTATLPQVAAAFAPILLVAGKIAPVFSKASGAMKKFIPVIKNAGSKLKFATQIFANFPYIAKDFIAQSGGMKNAISALTKGGITKLSGAFKAIASPAGLATAGIAVLVGAFMTLWRTNEGFRSAISGIWSQITGTISSFGQTIVQTLNGLGLNFESITQVISSVWNGFCSLLAPVFVGAFQFIADKITEITEIISGIIKVFAAAFQGDWSGCWEAAKGIVTSVWTFIASTIDNVGQTICGVINAFLDIIGSDWEISWDGIKATAEGIWNGISGIVEGAMSVIQGAIGLVMDIITGNWSGAWETIKTAATTVVDALPGALSAGWEALKSGISAVGSAIGPLLDSGWEALKSAASTAVNNLPGALSAGWEALKSGISTVGSAIGSLLDSGWEALKSAASTAVNNLPGALSAGWEALKSGISTVGSAIGSLLDSGWETLKSTASSVADGMSGLVSGGFEAMTTTISGIGDGLGTLLDSGWELLKGAAEGAANAVKSAWEGVKDFFGGIWDAITGGGDKEVSAPTVDTSGLAEGAQMQIQIDSAQVDAANAAVQQLQGSLESLQTGISAFGTAFSTVGTLTETAMSQLTQSTTQAVQSVRTNMTQAANIVRTQMTAIQTAVRTGATQAQTTTTMTLNQIQAITTSTMNAIRSIVASGMSSVVATVRSGMSQLVAAVQSGCNQAVSAARNAANSIRSAFASVSLYSAGVNMMQGLVNGINAMRGSVMAAAQSIAAAAASAVNSALKIHSPSRLMVESGEYTGQGLAKGIVNTAGIVQKAAATSMAQPVMETSDTIRKIEAPENMKSRSAVIGETIGTLTGNGGKQEKGTESDNAPTFVFSPTYNFEGEAPSKEDIVEANRMSQAEFEKMMKEYLRKNKRISFA